MRLFPLVFCVISFACQSNHFNSEKKADFVSPGSNVHHYVVQQEELKEMKTAKYRTIEYQVKLELLTQHQFVFLEFANLSEEELNGLPDITSEYSNISTAIKILDLSKHDYAKKYDSFFDRTITLYKWNREKYQPQINKLILIQDPAAERPYVALAFNNLDQQLFYHGFATSNKKLNPFPYTEIEEPEIAQTALAYFDSLSEYHYLKNEWLKDDDAIVEDEKIVRVFEWKKNDRFVFVQHEFNGTCDQLNSSYAALYHVTRDNWIQENEGVLMYNFLDLIDLDSDGYPELLVGLHGATAIIEINGSGFHIKKEIQWAEAECGC